MKKILQTWNRLRVWRLNRWADQLLQDSETYKREEATPLRRKATDVRALARRIQAARS